MRFAWVLVCGLAAMPEPLLAVDTADAGRELALAACSACHQVGPDDPRPGPVRNPDEGRSVLAPSFVEIARDPRKDGIYLRAVIRAPHYPMKEQAIDASDLDALVAYIEWLRPAPLRKAP
jgi:mono/diheme cytochrome c family protein